MTLKELYFKLKDQHEYKVILIKYGNFYRTYSDDTLILWKLFGYKISKGKVGFPIKILPAVIKRLNSIGFNLIIVDKPDKIIISEASNYFIDYKNFIEESKKEYYFENRFNDMVFSLKEKIKNNESKLMVLEELINEL